MAVVAIKTEGRCKLCKHPRREEIDALLERRSDGEKDDAGKRINLEYVLTVFAEWGVVNPTGDNVKSHWRKHCQKLSESGVLEEQAAMLDELKELLDRDPSEVDVNAWLKRIIQIDAFETEKRIREGRPSGVTKDHALKASQELSRRGLNEQQANLLEALRGGLGKAFADKALGDGQKAIPAVVDGEFVEEDGDE